MHKDIKFSTRMEKAAGELSEVSAALRAVMEGR